MFLTNLVDFCYLQGGLQASKHGIPGETSKNEVFNIRDTGRTQLFDGQITTYDGLMGKYGVYFPCDGKTVYIYLDDKDVIFS